MTLRAVGDVVDAVDTERLDPPDGGRIKGSTRIRTVLGKAARGRVPGSADRVPRDRRRTCRSASRPRTSTACGRRC